MRRGLMVLAFLGGLAIGVTGTVLAPRFLDPYLRRIIGGTAEPVEGTVVAKQREPERLLLTILTPQGALLATFKKRVTETALLVDAGDTVTLALYRYEPFVEEPEISRVAKQETPRKSERDTPSPRSSAEERVE